MNNEASEDFWEKVSTTCGVFERKEILMLTEKVGKDCKRARKEDRRRKLQKLYMELCKVLRTNKYVAQAILNDTLNLFCMSYKCKNCPILVKCKYERDIPSGGD